MCWYEVQSLPLVIPRAGSSSVNLAAHGDGSGKLALPPVPEKKMSSDKEGGDEDGIRVGDGVDIS